MQLLVSRHTVKSLDNVQAAKVSLDGDLLAARELAGNGQPAAEEGFAGMHMPVDLYGYLRHAFEVFGVGVDDDVYVLRARYHSPRSKGKSADHDELDLRIRKAPKDLIESRCAHRCAASAIRRSLWLRAMVSARFTLIGR